MASKKGISITAVILGAITAVSFIVWSMPQSSETTFVVSDYESHLDGVKNIHGIINESIDSNLQNLLNEEISPKEYTDAAEIASSQINSQIKELVGSKASEEWQESYINYMGSLRQFNSYIRETMVVADKISSGAQVDEIEEALEKVNNFKSESESLIKASDDARP